MKIAIASPDSEIVRPGARVGLGARIDHHRGLIIAISALLAMLDRVGRAVRDARRAVRHRLGDFEQRPRSRSRRSGRRSSCCRAVSICRRRRSCRSPTCSPCASCRASPLEQWGGVALILAIGGGIGLVNGALIAWFRLQSIVVTLATMFMVQGLTLLIQNKPGGSVGDQFGAFVTSDLIPDKMPMSAAVLIRRVADLVVHQAHALRRGPLCARQRSRRRICERHAGHALSHRDLCARGHVLRGGGPVCIGADGFRRSARRPSAAAVDVHRGRARRHAGSAAGAAAASAPCSPR